MAAEEFVRLGLGKMSLAEGNARDRFCAMLAGGDAVQQFQAGLINGCTLMTLLNQAMYCTLPPDARFGPSHPMVIHPVPQQPQQQQPQQPPPRFELPPPMLARRPRRGRNVFKSEPNPEDEGEEWEYIPEDHSPARPPLYTDVRLNIFADECVSYSEAEESPWAAVSKWQERFPFGSENAPEPPWCKDKHWPQSRWRFRPALPGRVVP